MVIYSGLQYIGVICPKVLLKRYVSLILNDIFKPMAFLMICYFDVPLYIHILLQAMCIYKSIILQLMKRKNLDTAEVK